MREAASDDEIAASELARLRRAAAALGPEDFERLEPPGRVWDRIVTAVGATGETTTTVEYVVDADDVVVAVGGDWAQFARENQAEGLTEGWRGRRLWDSVGDEDLRDVWRLLVSTVRSRRADLTVPFRCDAPRARRWFEMTVSVDEHDHVRFRSALVREEPRSPVALLDRGAERDPELEPVAVCSWCARGSLDGTWRDLDQLVAESGLLAQVPLPTVSYGICASCRDRMSGELLVDGPGGRRGE